MARKLKVWSGNLDGILEARVCATSKKAAAKAIGTSMGDFNNFYSEHIGPTAEEIAEPGVVFVRKMTFTSKEPWKKRG